MSRLVTKHIAPCLLPTAFYLLFAAGTAVSQSSTATLSGTVVDANGGAVPGASVTLSNTATGFERKIVTDDEGSFFIPLLQPANYTLTVARDGFASAQVENVILNVGDQKALRVELKVSPIKDEVIVTADASTVRTDGSVGNVIDRQFVQNIPLNGRSFQSLLELAPGVVITSGGSGFSVNGQRTNTNIFTVDGVSANTAITSDASGFAGPGGSGQLPGFTAQGTTASLVSADALQEFRIQTSSYAPEFGRQPGGQVSLVTRSGGNDFHGSAFDYVRNEVFDANNWFANRNGSAKPPTRQHIFGGTFSGPIYFPNFGDNGTSWYSGKDRTFFFFSYEGLRLTQPRTATIAVPNLCFRGESACPSGQSAALPQYHPFLKAFPKPNRPDVGNGFAGFVASYGDTSNSDTTALRLDHIVGRVTFFGRFSNAPSRSSVRDIVGLSNTQNSTQNNRSLTAGSIWTISTKIVNDLRVNFTTNHAPFFNQPDDFGGAVPLQNFGFLGLDSQLGRFQFSLTGVPSLGNQNRHSWGSRTSYKQRQFNIVDNLALTAGDHQLKFGIDFRRIGPLLQGEGDGGSEFIQFSLSNLSAGNTQSGRVSLWDVTVVDGEPHAVAFDSLSLYAQDTWNVTRRFTLTYGLRWEFVPPPHVTAGPEIPVFNGLQDPRGPDGISLAPIGQALWKTRYFNFAPRFGASFLLVEKPGRQLMLRGGAGIFYDLGLGQSVEGFLPGVWPHNGRLGYPIAGHPDPACATTLTFPLPTCALALPIPGTTPPVVLFPMNPEIELPRTYQWNLAVEQSLGSHQTITVSYVGAEGRKLLKRDVYGSLRIRGINYPGTSTTTFNIQGNGGQSDYHALQVSFQRRLSRGFQEYVSYTFGRSRDTDSSDTGITSPDEFIPVELNYGYSNFDIRHNLIAAATYEIPGLKGRNFLTAISRNWGVDMMFRYRTASPFHVSTTVPFLPWSTSASVRANMIPGVTIWVDDPNAPGGRRLNNAIPTAAQVAAAGCVPLAPANNPTNAKGAFCTPQPATQGNHPRNSLRGFGAKQVDLSLRREFPLFEQVKLQLRFEAFNLFNWPNFSNPEGLLSLSSFGQPGQTLNTALGGLNSVYQIGGPRSMQGAVRISF